MTIPRLATRLGSCHKTNTFTPKRITTGCSSCTSGAKQQESDGEGEKRGRRRGSIIKIIIVEKIKQNTFVLGVIKFDKLNCNILFKYAYSENYA